ncbi:hypothetical protein ACX80E_15585 [Arthrobacter sp. TMN-49]
MSAIVNFIVQAEKIGQYAVNNAHGCGYAFEPGSDAHHPGDDIGRLVLDAYRNHSVEEMKAVIKAYQAGYNVKAIELGDTAVGWEQIKNGVGFALPGASADELEAIPAAM